MTSREICVKNVYPNKRFCVISNHESCLFAIVWIAVPLFDIFVYDVTSAKLCATFNYYMNKNYDDINDYSFCIYKNIFFVLNIASSHRKVMEWFTINKRSADWDFVVIENFDISKVRNIIALKGYLWIYGYNHSRYFTPTLWKFKINQLNGAFEQYMPHPSVLNLCCSYADYAIYIENEPKISALYFEKKCIKHGDINPHLKFDLSSMTYITHGNQRQFNKTCLQKFVYINPLLWSKEYIKLLVTPKKYPRYVFLSKMNNSNVTPKLMYIVIAMSLFVNFMHIATCFDDIEFEILPYISLNENITLE